MANNEIIERIRNITVDAFPKDTDEEYTSEAVASAFSKIEALESPGFDGVARMLPQSRVRKMLIAVGTPALKYLEYALQKGGERQVKQVAVSILGEISGITMLETIMRNPEYEDYLRVEAAWLIGSKGKIDILLRTLNEDDESLRLTAIEGLNAVMLRLIYDQHQQLNETHEPIISAFIQALNDTNAQVRAIALANLRLSNRLTVDMISRALHDEDTEVREDAVRALFDFGIDQTTSPLLAEAIEDIDAEITSLAITNITYQSNKSKVNPQSLANAIIDVLILRNSGLVDTNFNLEGVANALQQTITLSPPLQVQILTRLRDLAYNHTNSVRTRSVLVARRLNADDFSALVQERSSKDPSSARAILQLLGHGSGTSSIIEQLSETPPGDVQKIVSLQTELLQQYYENALEQTKTSFLWAVISTMIGFVCLVVIVVYLLITVLIVAEPPDTLGILAGVSSILAQFLAGGQFWLYDRAAKRLAQSQLQLYQVQKFQLANSVCESLKDEHQQKTRSELVRQIANLEANSTEFTLSDT